MYEISFDRPERVHFIGIGGISMSGLAEILLSRGFTVSGSDNKSSGLTDRLESAGIKIYIGQRAENIQDGTDLVVYTAAIHEDNPELSEVRRRGLPALTRAELLGQIMKNYALPVAVSGTHGKTTTTSMLSMILMAADTDPTISVGGILKEIGGNIRIGHSDYFVTEACEYTNSFLSFFPKYGIILNIEEDHLDFFKDLSDIRHSFRKFAELLPKDGALIINLDIDNYEEITRGLACRVITYSASGEDKEADYGCLDTEYDDMGCASFELLKGDKKAGRISLRVPGSHNVSNALAAIAAAEAVGIAPENIKRGLLEFHGTDRRFEYRGEYKGIKVVDDYAHHPTEIRMTLKAAERYPHGTLWTVFQPHTYTRTKALFDDFVDALMLSDKVILAEIYPARETDDLGLSSAMICDALNKKGRESFFFDSFEKIEKFIGENLAPGDLLITMGAGDVVKIADDLTGKEL
ncbi:MAG: UDP-N-acetylmuramate--L-alanine ligase [Lachnospiraceae bacterium]|nr:UDP-N-acetylmuramate--L-alanine ligase [Lachnospiraceae bacterium]